MADLDGQEDALLAQLLPSEELRAVIPGLRGGHDDDRHEVLVGVTDRRVVLVGRDRRAAAPLFRVFDITECTAAMPHAHRFLAHLGGDFAFDVDDDSVARMWSKIDELTS